MKSFSSIIQTMSSNTGGQSKHLIAGLEKLDQAQADVDVLSIKARDTQALLSTKQKEVKIALGEIQKSMEQKAERKQEVEKLQAKCTEDE
jgi:dynein heavy chain 2